MPPSSSKSQIKSTEKNSPQLTQKKSRKRQISSCDRKSFRGKIPKMNRIDTYFKPIPKKTERKCDNTQDKKGNGRSSSNELEIYIVEDVDSDSSIELMGNVSHRDYVRTETHNSVIDELNSLEIECSQEDRIITTPILGEASDTKENLPCCHVIQVTQLYALKAKNVITNFTLGTQDNCIETYNIETDADMDVSESANNTDLHHYDKNLFQLDAETREIIRDWCGGDTFLTQESYSGEVMERDDNTTDKDNHNDVNEHHNWNNSNGKFDDDDDDDDDEGEEEDDDDDEGVMNGDLNHNGHDGDNDKSDTNNESDDDSDDDDDDDIESDHVNDEDYVYDSEDESDSEDDEEDNKKSNKFKHMLRPGSVQRKSLQRKKK